MKGGDGESERDRELEGNEGRQSDHKPEQEKPLSDRGNVERRKKRGKREEIRQRS